MRHEVADLDLHHRAKPGHRRAHPHSPTKVGSEIGVSRTRSSPKALAQPPAHPEDAADAGPTSSPITNTRGSRVHLLPRSASLSASAKVSSRPSGGRARRAPRRAGAYTEASISSTLGSGLCVPKLHRLAPARASRPRVQLLQTHGRLASGRSTRRRSNAPDRVALHPLELLFLRPVVRQVGPHAVPAPPVGHGLDQRSGRRPRAGPRHRLTHRLVHREHLVAVDLHARDAVGAPPGRRSVSPAIVRLRRRWTARTGCSRRRRRAAASTPRRGSASRAPRPGSTPPSPKKRGHHAVRAAQPGSPSAAPAPMRHLTHVAVRGALDQAGLEQLLGLLVEAADAEHHLEEALELARWSRSSWHLLPRRPGNEAPVADARHAVGSSAPPPARSDLYRPRRGVSTRPASGRLISATRVA